MGFLWIFSDWIEMEILSGFFGIFTEKRTEFIKSYHGLLKKG